VAGTENRCLQLLHSKIWSISYDLTSDTCVTVPFKVSIPPSCCAHTWEIDGPNW
jgi:hypothetical protein